jgi:hypothetical protein
MVLLDSVLGEVRKALLAFGKGKSKSKGNGNGNGQCGGPSLRSG